MRYFLFVVTILASPGLTLSAAELERPNILWLTSEDHGPHLGCYGDKYATTPNIDRLAAKGMIYTHAWSNAPVCAPARTTLISGMYAPSTGAEHMRSLVPYPVGKKMFPQLLRGAGYYCTNNVKEDYNLDKPGQVWDNSSAKAHWKNRRAGQPFFAVFNSIKSHESQIRKRPHKAIHDPAKVRVPAYHPDTPEVRQDWAQYYDQVSEADADAGVRLRELEQAGLAEDTIVFYFADHGSGMPRSKRSACDSGLHVPLVIHVPEKWRHLAGTDYRPGGRSERLVSFVDFAPTVLSLASIQPPDWMQGYAFLGKYAAPPQPFIYGFRARMDERYDMVRSATDGRYVYVRNYLPHLIPGQHNAYMFETPTTQVWKKLHDEGKLTPVQDRFWQKKPPEELYDLRNDPDEVTNLAGSSDHQHILRKLRTAQQDLARRILDVGFLPEGERFLRAAGASPYDMARTAGKYPFERIFAVAELASRLDSAAVSDLTKAMHDDDSAVRYWGALGILMRGANAVKASAGELRMALADRSNYVRIVAAEALGTYGTSDDLKKMLSLLVDLSDFSKHEVFTCMAALNALEGIGSRAASVADAVRKLPTTGKLPHERYEPFVPRLVRDVPDALR